MKSPTMNRNVCLLFYIVLVAPFSVVLFLYGFFPMASYNKNIATVEDIPKFIDNIRLKTDSLYEPIASRVIVMVIDALRWDFVTGPVGRAAMPVTSSLVENLSACVLRAKVEPPTVTMPRIKAITTGTIPSFIDVALNFGSKPVLADNLLTQAKRKGHRLVFYGDDTWLSLFPNTFEHYDGVTSFLVTDFTEVDNNVTRHLPNKLSDKDGWSIMILHYLGLDHIGHVHGPAHPLIRSKLREMDDIIAMIQSKVQLWNQNDDPTLFIICGDHGMKDSGGHGGSTTSETTVPLVAIGGSCARNHDKPTQIAQIDIAPTLSALLGLPIPYCNLGTVFLDQLYHLPVSKRLFILHYNAKQVFKHFRTTADYQSQYGYHKYMQAVKLHTAWLNTQAQPNDMTDDIVRSYYAALKGMKEVLINNMIKYDYHIIVIAIFFLCHTIFIAIGEQKDGTVSGAKVALIASLNVVLWLGASHIWDNESKTLLGSRDLSTFLLITIIILVLLRNCYLIAGLNYCMVFNYKDFKYESLRGVLLMGTIVHAISLGGSSFVEEEHQTWYFLWVSLLLIMVYNLAKRAHHTEISCKEFPNAQVSMKLLIVLVGHRILRHLNSTGDKYAYLPDYAGWLRDQENVIGMTILITIALMLLIRIAYLCEDKDYKEQFLILHVMAGSCVYIRQMRENAVLWIPFYPKSSRQYETELFWLLLLTYSVYQAYRLMKSKKTDFLKVVLHFTIYTWIMISAMIHEPQNVILLPVQVLFTGVLRQAINRSNVTGIDAFVYTCIGQVFYYYQGNSNSLATVNVAAGFVGVQSYIPFVNGSLMLINTYSAPVLAYLQLMYQSVLEGSSRMEEVVVKDSRVYITLRLIPVTLYTIIISVQRYHLFVWTVFSPKLLYEAVHTAVLCFFVSLVLTLVVVQRLMNRISSFIPRS